MKPHLIPFLLMLVSATCTASCSPTNDSYSIETSIEESEGLTAVPILMPEGSETEDINPNACIITFDGERTIAEMPITMVDSAEFHSKIKSARFMSHEKVDSIINANDITILNPKKDIYRISYRRAKGEASGSAYVMIKSSDIVYIIFDVIDTKDKDKLGYYHASTSGVEAIKQNDGKFALKALKNL